MKQNKLTAKETISFESENLVVDYITFKFQDLNNLHQTRIAKYLFQLGFNYYQESGKLAKPIKEPIFVHSKNKFQVCSIRNNSYWGGTLLNISGSNAAFFYRLVQEKYID